jgi:acetyl-CoA C-acetyltransferase
VALGIGPGDARPLTVTGGLPYHGGAGSDYLTHAVAQMVRVLRADPGAYGLVTGVGMHMTKHVAAVYSTAPPAGSPVALIPDSAPEPGRTPIVDRYEGGATVVAATVAFDRDGPAWGVAVCDVDGAATRCYARIEGRALLEDAASTEWTGRAVTVVSHPQREGVNLVAA